MRKFEDVKIKVEFAIAYQIEGEKGWAVPLLATRFSSIEDAKKWLATKHTTDLPPISSPVHFKRRIVARRVSPWGYIDE